MWSPMKKLVLTTALFLCSVFPMVGGTDPAGQQLLVTAKQQASLFHDQASPFQIDVDFVVQNNVRRRPRGGSVAAKVVSGSAKAFSGTRRSSFRDRAQVRFSN